MAKKNITKKATKTTKKKVVKAASNNTKKVTKKTVKKSINTKKVIAKKPIHKKPQGPKSKNKTTRVFSVLLALILLTIAAYLLILNGLGPSNNTSKSEIIFNDSMLNVIVLEDVNCSECLVDVVVDQMKQNIFPDLNPIRISHTSDLGKQIIEETKTKFLPSYLFEEKIVNDSKWPNLETAYNKVTFNNKTYYMINQNLIPNKVLVNEINVLDNMITIGNSDAKVTVYEFSDFECQFCAIAQGNSNLVSQFQKSNPTYEPIVPNLFEDYINQGLVKYVYFNFPLDNSHVRARGASIAAFCANEQGKWKEFSDKLYDERDRWMKAAYVEEVYIDFSRDLGMNIDLFGSCLADSAQKYSEQIDMEKELANEIGVVAAPTFIIDKNFIVGAIDYMEIKNLIDSRLEVEQ